MDRRHRRGGNAIEFALLLPVFIALLAGIMEYGWLFFMRATMLTAARAGCRAGSVVMPDSGDDPEEVAEEAMTGAMDDWTFFGVDCGDADDDRCGANADTNDTDYADTVLVCTLAIDYAGLTGVIPVPDQISVAAVSRIELQE